MTLPFQSTIRTTVRPGDIGAITQLHGVLYASEYNWPTAFEAYVAQGLANFVLDHDPNNDRIWIAEAAGKLTGSIAIVHTTAAAAQLRWFLVAPESRGSGLGHALLDAALLFCRERRFGSVFLWTVKGLDAAIHLYESAGFRLAEEHRSDTWLPGIVEQRYDLTLTDP
jgi:GNAT superfamily N-acetyltransferase